jgi:hypothetical protein
MGNPERLLARLSSLSKRCMITALMVDPQVWPAGGGAAAEAVAQIIRSSDWTGPVLLPGTTESSVGVDQLIAAGFPPRLIALPAASEERITALRRAFIDARGSLLSNRTERAIDSETLPLLKVVSEERR